MTHRPNGVVVPLQLQMDTDVLPQIQAQCAEDQLPTYVQIAHPDSLPTQNTLFALQIHLVELVNPKQ